jgi:stearoyl-CoA desaturase (delta-9 desaturase)
MSYSSLALTLVVTAVLVQAAVFSTTIYLHRAAAHKALTLHPSLAWVFRVILWLTTGISTREWVAVHRKHHAFTDKDGDPHSPYLEGFWPIQLGNVFYYAREARNREVIERYAHDIPNDIWERAVFQRGYYGPLLGIAVLMLALGPGWGLLAAGLHAGLYVFVLSPSVNGLCHHWGYKNFENTAFNIRLVALVTGGEGLHNNHHGVPRSPKFSVRRSELDPAWPVIKLLAALGLAKPYKTIEETRQGRHSRVLTGTSVRTVSARPPGSAGPAPAARSGRGRSVS